MFGEKVEAVPRHKQSRAQGIPLSFSLHKLREIGDRKWRPVLAAFIPGL
jgi:hypothetical protein